MKIGELAKQTNTSVETIRYYEKEALLPEPARSAGNYRLYQDEHKERLQFILYCRSLDMSLNDIRTLLEYWDKPSKSCADVNHLFDAYIDSVDERIQELKLLKQQLTKLRQNCLHEAPAESCGILQALADHSERSS